LSYILGNGSRDLVLIQTIIIDLQWLCSWCYK